MFFAGAVRIRFVNIDFVELWVVNLKLDKTNTYSPTLVERGSFF